jgi:Group 4 capsule polysaccharide lipoprotein gfcB, YjbF
VAVTLAARLLIGLISLSFLSGCGSQGRVSVDGPPLVATAGALAMSAVAEARARRSGAGAKAKKAPTRADIEKDGTPVLRVAIVSRGIDRYLSILDSRDDVVTWKTKDGTTFSLRNGVLIQTRGLGPDLMSSNVPTVGQLLQNGGTHQRQYFFLGPNDQPTRRTYDCTVTIVGSEEIVILERTHQVTHATEDCVRPQSGKITNDFWFEGQTIRKSRQWVSALTGHADFERVVD